MAVNGQSTKNLSHKEVTRLLSQGGKGHRTVDFVDFSGVGGGPLQAISPSSAAAGGSASVGNVRHWDVAQPYGSSPTGADGSPDRPLPPYDFHGASAAAGGALHGGLASASFRSPAPHSALTPRLEPASYSAPRARLSPAC